jgi:DNA (cytosine-5)-methyltransferase 1
MMALQATRTIGTGDGWDRTDSGLYIPDWASVEDVRPGSVIENPGRQPIGIDLFAGAGGFSCGFKQAGWHVIAANENDVDAAHTYLLNLGSRRTRIMFCTPEDEDRWQRGRKRLERYHAQPNRTSLEPGSGWIAGQPDVQPCEVLFFGDVRALTGRQILAELELTGDEIGCVFGGPPCQGFSRAGQRQADDPRNELVFEFMRVVCEIHPRSFVMENVPGMLDMVTRDGVPVIDALALMAQEGGMGTFQAIRRSLAETAGVGGALRTMQADASRRQPQPGISGNGHVRVQEEQLPLFDGARL